MKYRPEVDGLRAVAIIPVILFHTGFKVYGGGFVGVDIFFVISGYLITKIILTEKESNTFSLAKFYERRARRILPVLFLVMLISFLYAWFTLMPSDMKYLSKSLVAIPTYTSNILFWKESNYWNLTNEMVPLLHTWTLAIEEQYYILFPLFIILIWRFNKNYTSIALSIITTVSLFLAHYLSDKSLLPHFIFYRQGHGN